MPDWFPSQLQNNTSRRLKFDLCYSKFSLKFNELSLTFQKQQEVAKKWLKLKQPRKLYICGIRRLRTNSHVKNPRVVSKEGRFVIF